MMPSVPRHRVIATALAVASLAACGSQASTGVVAPAPSASASPGGDPSRLVATWTVSAPAASEGAVVIIGDRVDGGLELFLDCGLMFGAWRANARGMFVASESGGDGACFDHHSDPWPTWLDAVGFSYDGNDALLLSGEGNVLARLAPGGHPTTGPDDSAEFASPPVVTGDMREKFAEPAPLPAGVEPATAADIRGRWLPVDRAPAKAYLQFNGDNSYGGSDGCNGVGGRYVVGDGGLFIATAGGSTMIGCDNSPLPSWPAQAARLGLRGDHLVFVDPHGRRLGEAVKAN